MQNGVAGDMIFSVGEQIAYLSGSSAESVGNLMGIREGLVKVRPTLGNDAGSWFCMVVSAQMPRVRPSHSMANRRGVKGLLRRG
jgi:hypothetical protein